MKIKFIGVGSAFTTQEYYQSNILITAINGKTLLVDCGTDARFALNEQGIDSSRLSQQIDAVYISHLHADHIGGLEWLALNTYFCAKPKKLSLFIEKKLMRELWENCLKGGLECIENKNMHLTDYFTCYPIDEHSYFNWENIQFKLVRMPHVITDDKNHFSYGLLIQEVGMKNQVFLTTDTQFVPHLICDIAENVDIIFHDCETTNFKTPVHSHYKELMTLEQKVKQKMWLYHYQPKPTYQPEKDGFKGFVIKGQEFEFSS